jgi:hypothetical protein
MIMTIAHPDWQSMKFKRRFAPSEPHTTGKARSCESCHSSAVALGLGQGVLRKSEQQWSFSATHKTLQDGLPADAWTSFDEIASGHVASNDNRPFNHSEILHILNALQQ